jgi:hypothetical protein
MFALRTLIRNQLHWAPLSETNNRLSVGMSTAVVAGFSALSWAVLMTIVVGARAML